MSLHPYNREAFSQCFSNDIEIIATAQQGGYFRLREIDNTSWKDAVMLAPRLPVECPLFWEEMLTTLQEKDIVCAAFVPDPLTTLKSAVSSLNFHHPFKTHYVVDYSKKVTAYSGNHKRNISYAKKRVEIKRVSLQNHIDTWLDQWSILAKRHRIDGWNALCPAYFENLSRCHGFITHAAFDQKGHIIAMSIWTETKNTASAHLSVCSAEGYKAKANYALYAYAVDDFKNKDFLDFGSNVGLKDDPEDGLSYFKSGFCNAKLQSYVCGIICDAERYEDLSKNHQGPLFFPAYRTPKVIK